MARYKYYHVYIAPKKGISPSEIVKKMNLSLGWFRYASNCWVLYSTSSLDKWMTRLKPLIGKSGYVFIAEMNPNKANGWMPNDFWEWFDEEG